MNDWTVIRNILESGSPVLMLGLFIFSLMKGWFYLKPYVDDLKERLTEIKEQARFWQAMALDSLGLLNRATSMSEKVILPEFTKETRNRLDKLEEMAQLAEKDGPRSAR